MNMIQSLWKVNFGHVEIPRRFDYPRPQKLAALAGVHGVSSEPIVVVDAQTLLIPGFSYDGEAPGKLSIDETIQIFFSIYVLFPSEHPSNDSHEPHSGSSFARVF